MLSPQISLLLGSISDKKGLSAGHCGHSFMLAITRAERLLQQASFLEQSLHQQVCPVLASQKPYSEHLFECPLPTWLWSNWELSDFRMCLRTVKAPGGAARSLGSEVCCLYGSLDFSNVCLRCQVVDAQRRPLQPTCAHHWLYEHMGVCMLAVLSPLGHIAVSVSV